MGAASREIEVIMQILPQHRRSPLRKGLASSVTMLVAGGAALLLLTLRALSSQALVGDGATLLGTLVLAAGVVLVANYLSTGSKSKRVDRIGIRYDKDL